MSLTPQQQSAVDQIAAAAVASEKATGVPAVFSTSQAIFESAYLTAMPEGSNNCLGIKSDAHGSGSVYSLTEEYLDGQWKRMPQAFEKYATLADCFNDHARLLSQPPYLKFLQIYLQDKELVPYIRAVSLIYATDPNYANSMVSESQSSTVVNAVERARAAMPGR